MLPEIWQSIPGFSKYEGSTWGRIRRKRNARLLALHPNSQGYLKTTLSSDAKGRVTALVHILIASTFIANPQQKSTVNHKDHTTFNNNLENLEWATRKEQNDHKKPKVMNAVTRAIWQCDAVSGNQIQKFRTCMVASLALKGSCRDIWNAATHGYVRLGYKWKFHDDQPLPGEIWRDIPGFMAQGLQGYQISSEARIKTPTGRIRLPHACGGYMFFSIQKMKCLAHILVAHAFLPNFHGKGFVNHKDGNKKNSRLWNLEWATRSENALHALDTGLLKIRKPVTQISLQGKVIATFSSIKEAARKTNGNYTGIAKAAAHHKRSGNCKWEYVNLAIPQES